MRQFKSFVCIDWSGAAGDRLKGLAIAQVEQNGPPSLIEQKHAWSRQEILCWLGTIADAKTDMLIGLDLSLGFPFADQGCYFPQWRESPKDAKSLWKFVDETCATDLHLGASSFLQHNQGARHFRHAKDSVGDLFEPGVGRLRVVESHQRTTKQANSWSCFNLIGAGQVGKSSLTGMRMLHRLNGKIPVWPFDPVPETGPMIVEIYTSMSARAAGIPANRSKIRDRATLKIALERLHSPCPARLSGYDDHKTDALLTAAWLRKTAPNQQFWHPKHLNDKIRATEGWTFGVI